MSKRRNKFQKAQQAKIIPLYSKQKYSKYRRKAYPEDIFDVARQVLGGKGYIVPSSDQPSIYNKDYVEIIPRKGK